MNDMEFRDLMPRMKEIVRLITDADVARYPAVRDATAEVAGVQAEHATLRGAVTTAEANIEAVELRISDVEKQIEAKEGARRALAVEIFNGTGTDEEDQTMYGELQDLGRRRGLLGFVLDSFREQHQLALREINRPSRANTRSDAGLKLERAVWRATLEAARDIDTHYHGNVETWRQKRASSERSAQEVA